MAKPGPKTDLTKKLLAKLKKNIMDGKNLISTAKACNLSESTLYTWHSDNYLNLADEIYKWRLDRKLKLASENLDEMLVMKTKNMIIKGDDIVEIEDTGLKRIKADMTKFTLETLGKKDFGKNVDMTTKGEKVTPIIDLNKYVQGNNGDSKDSDIKEKD